MHPRSFVIIFITYVYTIDIPTMGSHRDNMCFVFTKSIASVLGGLFRTREYVKLYLYSNVFWSLILHEEHSTKLSWACHGATYHSTWLLINLMFLPSSPLYGSIQICVVPLLASVVILFWSPACLGIYSLFNWPDTHFG